MKINTSEIRNKADSIKVLSDDFKSDINDFFTKLNNVNSSEKSWVGNGANAFVVRSTDEKKFYDNYYNELLDFVKLMNDCCDDLEKNCRDTWSKF